MFQDEPNFQCEACIFGKQHRLNFGARENKSDKCGEVIHTDVCEMDVKSLGGAHYFLLLKDDFSHYRFVYFLRHKSEVPDKIKSFVSLVETQTSYKIKILRSDNGREYVNAKLVKFLEEKGIKHVCTVPYTPEQNGSSERENRTLVEAARSMIYSQSETEQKLFLWAEAINTAVHVINRTGTSTIKDKSPYELWYGKTAKIDDFKIFGSVIYVHIPKQKRKKLDKKSVKCVFVGYGDHTNVYRVYNSERRAVEVARDVIFERESHTQTEMTQSENNQSDSVAIETVSFEREKAHKQIQMK